MLVVWHSLAVDPSFLLKMLRINTWAYKLKNKGTTKHCQKFENLCMVKNFQNLSQLFGNWSDFDDVASDIMMTTHDAAG